MHLRTNPGSPGPIASIEPTVRNANHAIACITGRVGPTPTPQPPTRPYLRPPNPNPRPSTTYLPTYNTMWGDHNPSSCQLHLPPTGPRSCYKRKNPHNPTQCLHPRVLYQAASPYNNSTAYTAGYSMLIYSLVVYSMHS